MTSSEPSSRVVPVGPAEAASPRASWLALWRIAQRDLSPRFRGLRLLLLCLFLGVATLAAIGSLTAAITDTLEQRGRVILGGDIEFALGQRQANNAERKLLAATGKLSQSISMQAMALTDGTLTDSGDSLLSELKAVDDAYPLYGEFRLTDRVTSGPPPPGTVWIGSDMANRLNLQSGDTLRFGSRRFQIAGIIADEPDRLGEGFTLGPVAIIGLDDLASTALIQPGSLFESKYRLRLPANVGLDEARDRLISRFPETRWGITDRTDGAPGTRRFVERMGQFLLLIGLAALAIAGIGVGNGVTSYLQGKRKCMASMKILGADSVMITYLYGVQIAIVALVGIAGGLLAGFLLPSLAFRIIGDVLPVPQGFALYLQPLLIAAVYGALITVIFALPPLAASRFVSAASLYRAEVEPQKRKLDWKNRMIIDIALVLLAAIAVGTAVEPKIAAIFILTVFFLLLLLWGVGRLVAAGAKRLPRARQPLIRLAISSLYQPGSLAIGLIIAFGVGLTLFVALAAIQTSITSEIARVVPQRAPSFFILDIPRDGVNRFRKTVTKAALDADINLIPALRGHITAYGGNPVNRQSNAAKNIWLLRGDRGLTYSAEIPRGSKLAKGQWWPQDYHGPPLVSLDDNAAALLGVDIGDNITVNTLGVEIKAQIASLRTVEWSNMGLNYAMVFSPGSFAGAPHNMIATITVPNEAERTLERDLPQLFPSASLIAVRDIVSQASIMLSQISLAVATAASITILAGITVLIGAIAASRERKIYDSIVLKMLGATRRQILITQAIEYAILILIPVAVALVIGLLGARYVIVDTFSFSFDPNPLVVAAALLGGGGLAFLIGIIVSLPLLAVRPAVALRDL